MTKRTQDQGRIEIVDHKGFGELLGELEKRFDHQTAAAMKCGISRTQFNRLRNGRGGTNLDTLKRIYKLLRVEQRAILDRTVLKPDGQRVRLAYQDELRPRLIPYGLRVLINRTGQLLSNQDLSEIAGLWAPKTVRDFEDWSGPDDILRRTYREIRQHKTYRDLFNSFIDWCVKRGHGDLWCPRVTISIIRTLEPILPTQTNIDLNWKDLHKKKYRVRGKTTTALGRYLKRALENEKLLLDRRPDLQRIQDLTALTRRTR